MADPELSVTVTGTHNPLSFLLSLTKFVVAVDGAAQDGPWGERAVAVTPGPHSVRMWFRYLGRECGVAEVSIDAAPGTPTSISSRAPMVVFSPGKASVQQ